MEINDLAKIKERLSQKQSERDKLLGKKEGILEQFKKLGYRSLKEAEISLKKLDTMIIKQEEIFEDSLRTFKEKFEELLQ